MAGWRGARQVTQNARAEAEKTSAQCVEQQKRLAGLTTAQVLAKAGFKLEPKAFGLPETATSPGEQAGGLPDSSRGVAAQRRPPVEEAIDRCIPEGCQTARPRAKRARTGTPSGGAFSFFAFPGGLRCAVTPGYSLAALRAARRCEPQASGHNRDRPDGHRLTQIKRGGGAVKLR